ncbi:hypothetical protein Fleli_1377 [Bernardetia litoralis DSM 6794]|uniref:Lipoprotein n=1 Tax=Bernardetia litoralis (strain ATCC 23117 / DSM 6794 / NBRC 15988 / NCIMB 1366 / Fx l1 / Sio-4) TaxID=880071 RepID=I4AIM3_BERLS|nr:hypothetical protein [Bernardetia litoralis]AFM03808.1 hypothetical protein Fleli_1377 [Bernardetia litoralis DSM 6794]
MKIILSRAYVGVLGLLLCFSLSSCFDVNEVVSMNKDGSGRYGFMLDFKDNFAFKYAKDDKLKNQIDSSLDVMIEKAKNTKGISNVEKKIEGTQYGLKYSFENVEALNKAIDRKIDGKLQKLYSYKKGVLTHYNILPIENGITKNGVTIDDVLSDDIHESKQSSIDMNKNMFKGFHYGLLIQSDSKEEKVTIKESHLEPIEKAATENRVFLSTLLNEAMMSEISETKKKTVIKFE